MILSSSPFIISPIQGFLIKSTSVWPDSYTLFSQVKVSRCNNKTRLRKPKTYQINSTKSHLDQERK